MNRARIVTFLAAAEPDRLVAMRAERAGILVGMGVPLPEPNLQCILYVTNP